MLNLTPFDFQGRNVRVVMIDGEPYFVAADVARVLGYSNPQEAVRDHCKGVRETLTPTKGGQQKIKIIPERDVYRLVMRSKLPAAERFEEWVVGEVLPSIRKTGSYGQPVIDMDAILENPAKVRYLLLHHVEARIEAETKVREMQPVVSAYNRIAQAQKGAMCITNTAKTLQRPPKEIFAWLEEHKWIYRRTSHSPFVAYQDKLQSGYLEHKVKEVKGRDGTPRVEESVLVTPKGLARLALALNIKLLI